MGGKTTERQLAFATLGDWKISFDGARGRVNVFACGLTFDL